MRLRPWPWFAICLSVGFGLGPGPSVGAARDDRPRLDGSWKLVVLARGEDEFLILETLPQAPELRARVLDAQPFLGEPLISNIVLDDQQLRFVVDIGNEQTPFLGVPGDDPDRFLGAFVFQGAIYPARLEKTAIRQVAPLGQPQLLQRIFQAAQAQDPKTRIERLEALLAQNADNPINYHIHQILVISAAEADLDAEQLRPYVENWLEQAAAYGPVWLNEVRSKVVEALKTSAADAADLLLELAVAADQELDDDAPLALRLRAAQNLADVAAQAGATETAQAAERRVVQLEALDKQRYLARIPPFRPQPFAGRADPRNDRVVLMELFTGAECPPCVASDAAFDALITTFAPREAVFLQYHLHVPGPDPLTNPDAVERSRYYNVPGTPAVYINGTFSGGGGDLAAAKTNYDHFRHAIENALGEPKPASIDLNAQRDGGQIRITASARIEDGTNAETARLRLALIERSVRYPGGNGLRFHSHVVRALPGGPEGLALTDGQGQADLTVNLDELRASLDTYLKDYQRQRGFPNPLPPLRLEALAVVAFVQNDADHSVLHAVMVPLDDPTAETDPHDAP